MTKDLFRRESLGYIEGQGDLGFQNQAVRCSLKICILSNGRIRVEASGEEATFWPITDAQNLHSEIGGRTSNGAAFQVKGFYVSRENSADLFGDTTLVGYARSLTIECNEDNPIHTIKADLIGFRVLITTSQNIHINGHTIELKRQRWRNHDELDEHGYIYQHTMVSSQLATVLPSGSDVNHIERMFNDIAALLAIASREYVFVTAIHHYDAAGKLLVSRYIEPPFQAKGYGHPLVQTQNIADFITTTYPMLLSNYTTWNFRAATDHYQQAMTMRSAWPMAVCIFTAIESLKKAFEKSGHSTSQQYQIPKSEFNEDQQLVIDIKAVLADHFPQFNKLAPDDEGYLIQKVRDLNLKPWTFREQLTEMLEHLTVAYTESEIKDIIRIRNSIIHTGTPISTSVTPDMFPQEAFAAWEISEATVALFETTLLAILGYGGKRTLFNQVANLP